MSEERIVVTGWLSDWVPERRDHDYYHRNREKILAKAKERRRKLREQGVKQPSFRSIYNEPGMPEWEQELWREATHAAGTEPKSSSGDWIPYGRIPLEYLPSEDELPDPYPVTWLPLDKWRGAVGNR